ncbi:MAG TPA: hypothetical protein PLG17_00315 [Thermodesulfobacteriota bacterium]|nr:hypothetical protein [Thermodesulfobacteriota bacterium]HNU71223.1 hypothetical protein [Thermodesulfobacteriota bacterium]HQO76932.1 hypothetical protein [Thermodesulfobacteriota bacterium]
MAPRRFLESHDRSYDFCRTYLVLGMIFAHTFSWYYCGTYYNCLLIMFQCGFIYMAGFTSAVLYSQKLSDHPKQIRTKLFTRFYQFMALFILLNLFICTMRPERLYTLTHAYSLPDIVFRIIILRENANLISFEMLVPIAFTCLFSWFLIRSFRPRISLLLALFLILSLFLIEATGRFNYYGIRFIIIGLIGCLTGIFVSTLPWDKVKTRLMAPSLLLAVCLTIIVYLSLNYIFREEQRPIFYSVHVTFAVLNLLFAYQVAEKLQLAYDGIFSRLFSILGERMLFVYVVHLMIIYLLSGFIGMHTYSFFHTIAIAGGIILATAGVCHFVIVSSIRYPLVKNAYLLFFK